MANPIPGSPSKAFESICVNYYASAAKSTQAKHDSVADLIQKYIDDLQTRLELPSQIYNDLTEIGGSPSTKDEDIKKWWFAFWEGQPTFWFGLKKSNGTPYATSTLERYMNAAKNRIKKYHFIYLSKGNRKIFRISYASIEKNGKGQLDISSQE
jgi:hypothetical protein